jgi:hypothetical protein
MILNNIIMSQTLNDRSLDGLHRALASPQGWNRDLSKPYKAPTPDLPLSGLLVRVYRHLGGSPSGSQNTKQVFFDRVDKLIMDTVSQKRLSVWARYGKRPLTLISKDDWDNGTFDHKRKCFMGDRGYSPRPPEYEDLHFNKDEIDAIWPQND